ncbi:MAG: response regulator [Gammaproteobacteria bacterium]|nr:response regulator [Gammaproteobacteria bacterium]MCP5199516.1 response regulator [Gammaproteobacteria bacterium]
MKLGDDYERATPARILLVEDSPSDQELTREAFAEVRLVNAIDVVETGEEALDFLYRRGSYGAAARPDVILLDLNLPGLDGREVLATIKGDEDLKRIPVIVLTTSDDEHDIYRSYGMHANCYITKPVDFRKFIAAMEILQTFWLNLVKLPPNRH